MEVGRVWATSLMELVASGCIERRRTFDNESRIAWCLAEKCLGLKVFVHDILYSLARRWQRGLSKMIIA